MTQKTQHTSGPWRISPSGKLICTANESEPHVNICIIEDNGNDSLAPMPNEVWPNARLLASAPELLEALRYFLLEADKHAIGDIPSGFHEMAKHARIAIAKATGN